MAAIRLPGGASFNTLIALGVGVALFAVISAMSPAIGQLTGRIPRTVTA